MERMIGQISILVKDYDEALRFYINKLGFVLVEDTNPSKKSNIPLFYPVYKYNSIYFLNSGCVELYDFSRKIKDNQKLKIKLDISPGDILVYDEHILLSNYTKIDGIKNLFYFELGFELEN